MAGSRCWLISLLLVVLLSASIARAEAPAKSAGTLYLVAVAINQNGIGKSDESIDDFNWCATELVTEFRRESTSLFKTVKTFPITGAKATREQLFARLNAVKASATPDDVVFFYMGMHGGTDPKDGWSVGLAGDKGVGGKELKELLGQFNCQVVCLIETCGSGGFARPHKNDIALPPNCTALCCCRAKQGASNELDIAVGEALQGRADFDHNGVIQLEEVIKYVKLRYEASFGKEGADCVIVSAKNPTAAPLAQVAKNMVAIFHEGGWYSGLLEAKDGDDYKVRVTGFNNGDPKYGWYVTNKVKRDEIVLPDEGPPLIVEQNGTWYCARQIGTAGKEIKVKYVGYDEEETVTSSRVKYPAFVDPTAETAQTKRKTSRRSAK